MNTRYLIPGYALLALIGLGVIAVLVIGPSWAPSGSQHPGPTLTPSATASPSATPEPSPSVTPTTTASPSVVPSATQVPTLVAVRADAPSATPSPTHPAIAVTTEMPTVSPTPAMILTPLPTPDGVTRVERVPILMYHHIAVPPSGANAVERDLSVPPEAFELQLRYLTEHGYTSVTLSDLVHHLARGTHLPPNPIILTFDDGYKDIYTGAFPLLQKYHMSATFFLITGLIDREDPRYVSWSQVEEMHSAGMQFGSHSYTHPDLRGKPPDYLVWQILGSKEAIEMRTEQPLRFFSYPSGMYDTDTIAILRSANFWGAVTTRQGTEQSSEGLFQLQRIRVRGSETLASLEAKLKGDW